MPGLFVGTGLDDLILADRSLCAAEILRRAAAAILRFDDFLPDGGTLASRAISFSNRIICFLRATSRRSCRADNSVIILFSCPDQRLLCRGYLSEQTGVVLLVRVQMASALVDLMAVAFGLALVADLVEVLVAYFYDC